ncbi:hypothetical protein PDJAM_G00175870 [Pangasius djambal]|uniref:Uncharacterized protein n=1 Tax=Pangasius djambal TaxID=1691987 RepID=A0ACC5ZP97_9TELE|nr:hypothetical protein [Pangasius djambal]
MLQFPATLLRAAVHTHLSSGVLKCVCRSVWAKTGGWKTKKIPPRYLGQPSPYTHPHLIKHGEVTPGVTQTEYELRRQCLASLIESRVPDSSHVLVVLSHPVRYMTNDIPYPFHQNQDFLYLTGVLEPDCALVMYGSPRPDRTLLFVPPRNPARELWDGPRSGQDGAAALTGIQTVHSIEELGSVLNAVKGSVVWYDSSQPVHPRLHQTQVRPLLEGQVSVRPLRPLTHSLRAIKSPAEVDLMKQAGHITAHAFRKTMAMCRGDIDEALIYAKFDFECRAHGANFLAYPPVVAGGNRANTLHYISNNQIVKDGEMVLLDGGCEYFGYVSDVTRTWPVSGKFSEVQRCVYEAVLEVQSACLSLCVPGVSLDHIYSSMLTLLAKQLLQLGSVVWYDSSQPVHPRLHQTQVRPLLEGQVSVRPLRPLTHSLRAIKSPAEVDLMKQAGHITAHAFRKTMAMCRGDIDEALIYAKFDFECRAHGANFLAYPPVVAGGNRANTLHYISNNQIVKDGEMVLLDGGCEYFGYVSDVTRTWPVSGKFSEVQRCVYEAVLEVQSACLSLCVPGVSLDHIYSSMLTLLAKQLLQLGVLPHDTDYADALKAARRYCPHHVGHYLGLYFSEDDESCPQHFRGLGVRIEDDVVIREHGGPLILSAHTPKSVCDVERACAHSEG